MSIKTAIFFTFCLSYSAISAQEWLQNSNSLVKGSSTSEKELNFFEVQKVYRTFLYDMLKHNQPQEDQMCATKISEKENQFYRWEWFTEQRVYPSGFYPQATKFWKDFHHNRNSLLNRNKLIQEFNSQIWHPLISAALPSGGSSTGMGRINCLAFVPGSPGTYLVGAATGGLWKTTDDGLNWICLNSDLLPALSISDIAVNPINNNEIYVVTGDMFAGFPGIGKSLQGHFSAGVLKSSDGGLTWKPTGMSFSQNQMIVPQRMLIHPINDDSIIVASFNGVWRSINAGKNWTKVKDGTFFSMEANPKRANTLYLTDANGLWRSDNFGTSWTWKGGGYSKTGSFRISLCISKADTNIVYLWGQGGAFKKYNSTTKVFTTLSSPDGLVHPYGLYDRALAVAPWSSNILFVGGSEAAKSTNGGNSWNLTAQWTNEKSTNYIHQDVKRYYFIPSIDSSILALTDGGIFKSLNLGATWTNISKGINIAQIYRICNHPNSPDTIIIGQQDCATNRFVLNDSTMKQVFGGDGMQSLFDPNLPSTLFVCGAYGNLQKSKDGGKTFSLASPGQCMWIAPYAMNPKNSKTMYIGAKIGVRKSTIGGEFMSWTTMSTSPILDSVIAIGVSDADTNVVYAAKSNKIVRSDDGGNTWVNVTAGLPTSSASISYLEVSATDRNRVYVCFSGYSAQNKIFVSTNGGTSWDNYSGSLSNVPVNCILHLNDSPTNEVFAGTDFGIYYRNSNLNDWISFNAGLPNVIVNHLQIEKSSKKLRAGTYGRGLWEYNLPNNESSILPVNDLHKTLTDDAKIIAKTNTRNERNIQGQPLLQSKNPYQQIINLYPNPAKSKSYLESLYNLDQFNIKLYSAEGKDFSNSLVIDRMGEKRCLLKWDQISPGLYYVVLVNGTDVFASAKLSVNP